MGLDSAAWLSCCLAPLTLIKLTNNVKLHHLIALCPTPLALIWLLMRRVEYMSFRGVMLLFLLVAIIWPFLVLVTKDMKRGFTSFLCFFQLKMEGLCWSRIILLCCCLNCLQSLVSIPMLPIGSFVCMWLLLPINLLQFLFPWLLRVGKKH